MAHGPRFEQLCLAARAQVNGISVAETKALLDEGRMPLLIDVREVAEWALSRLPDAVYMGKGVLERDIEAAVPDLATPMILYCGGGYRSALSAENLQKMGYTAVVSMDGGFRGWCEVGYPLVTPE
ncbi:MAG: rhodanese-like domain-containing protein [Neisseriaceae bacterium]|nr:rhodanese-like domain-containing protein [Neisseriaceae bacterium]